MRWPWPSRSKIDGIVWTALALRRHGAMVAQLVRDTDYRPGRVRRSLNRLEDKGRVTSRIEQVPATRGLFRVWYAAEPQP